MTNTQRAYNRLEKLNLSVFNESVVRNIIGELSLAEYSEGLDKGMEIEMNAHNIVNK
jgi:hypothetical protein|tara:strand:+ start:276 stop:446 length:171 start_codon:yes stop_codon:yes gene_type:complete